MKELSDRVAVVTGGASGIGFALAQRFVSEGMKVVVADIEKEGMDEAVATLSAGGGQVLGVRTDVSRLEDVEALAQATLDRSVASMSCATTPVSKAARRSARSHWRCGNGCSG